MVVKAHLICQYGSGCRADSDCVPGNKCDTHQLPYYSQCIPDPSTYSTNPTCLLNWGGRCSSTADCCDPGSYCSDDSFRQCQQPQLYLSQCLWQPTVTTITAAPSSLQKPSSLLPSSRIVTSAPQNSPTVYSPSQFPKSTAVVAPASLSTQLICQFGSGCRADSDCVPGNKCDTHQLPYYSQCIPDPSTYSTNPTCLLNWGGRCSNTADCCDPGSYCSDDSFRQCQQPQLYLSQCLWQPTVTTITAAPSSLQKPSSLLPSSRIVTSAPQSTPAVYSPSQFPKSTAVVAPASLPTQLICQFGSGCRADSDCVPGNKCDTHQLPYYSQCIPDPSTYSTNPTCLLNWGGRCSSTADCCDPGSYCSDDSFRQCQQPQLYLSQCLWQPSAVLPSSTLTAKPSVKPTFSPTVVPSQQPTPLPQYYPSIRPTTIAPTQKPNGLPTIVVTAAPTIYYSCYNKTDCSTHLAVLALPDPRGHINNAAFKSSYSLTAVLIDVTVVSIGIAVFVDCTSLSSIIVPTTVTEVGSSCFQGCTSLRTILLPTSLTFLPDFLFQLSGLISIVIPTTVTKACTLYLLIHLLHSVN